MFEIVCGVLMATGFYIVSKKLQGCAKLITLILCFLSIMFGVYGVSVTFM